MRLSKHLPIQDHKSAHHPDKNKGNPDALARRWIEFYRDKVMPEHPCTDVEGLISLFEHGRAHYGKMIATLLPTLGMLTGGGAGQTVIS